MVIHDPWTISLCTYQWYAAYLGERRGIYRQNLPQGVGTQSGLSQSTEIAYTFSIILLNVFGKFFVNSTLIFSFHTLCTTERYRVFVRDMYYVGMVRTFALQVLGACSMSIPFYPPMKPQVL